MSDFLSYALKAVGISNRLGMELNLVDGMFAIAEGLNNIADAIKKSAPESEPLPPISGIPLAPQEKK